MGKDKPNGLVAYESYCLYTLTLYSLYKNVTCWMMAMVPQAVTQAVAPVIKHAIRDTDDGKSGTTKP